MASFSLLRRTPSPSIFCLSTIFDVQVLAEEKMLLHGSKRVYGLSISNWSPVCLLLSNTFVFALSLFFPTDFSKLTTYLCFFTIILTFYGLPLNIVRDIYFTARSFVTRLKALRRYQTATRNMDERYPNATPEEMASSDHTCIICREEMILPAEGAQPAATEGPNTTPKKLPCGHIFHFHCLRSWLERQQSCPTWWVPSNAFYQII